MPGEKFIQHDGSGSVKETVAVQTGGVDSANKIPSLDAQGRIALNMLPAGVGPDTINLVSGENLAAGDVVYVASTGKVWKSNATDNTKPVVGFVLNTSDMDATAMVYMEGPITGLAGLTIGARMYLSAATSGTLTSTPPAAPGNIVQFVGRAMSATMVNFEPNDPVLLA